MNLVDEYLRQRIVAVFELKKLSMFKFGLFLSIIGAVWLGVVFWQAEKVSESFNLEPAQTVTLDIMLPGSGIAFYKIFIPDFTGDALFVQILDSNENILVDKRIETKMAVNYFDFDYGGKYTLKATNLSKDTKIIEVEVGDMNITEMRIPGIIMIIGLLIIIISFFRKLQNYRTAQPEENIS
jgi:hypothetical protein